ncbi:hypothetical protein Pst134EA_025844 [Puccinia striiformis f. sp. tritici]|uniref:hypothetical protein n=1 Tax=Puccinia striiformis f. sp. tritici TaxID=168172 RepID=UPI0020081631|nr:hypothetical protein Pst134EA_025844 [Puccinia striiformis f. sp. tritici]KAH9444027.1 hypothetical protein Pst134EB_026415 [Puccinia striiformis f. sp. tritici]KAH9451905.1 hypothetical protein Pst134EA_025844 [Puccinia striiformis f. sp. tritici]KAI9625382.1 hypothetical protein KEM48_010954 [Puccinia striiformis f. sp. tritici PST-130]
MHRLSLLEIRKLDWVSTDELELETFKLGTRFPVSTPLYARLVSRQAVYYGRLSLVLPILIEQPYGNRE